MVCVNDMKHIELSYIFDLSHLTSKITSTTTSSLPDCPVLRPGHIVRLCNSNATSNLDDSHGFWSWDGDCGGKRPYFLDKRRYLNILEQFVAFL